MKQTEQMELAAHRSEIAAYRRILAAIPAALDDITA